MSEEEIRQESDAEIASLSEAVKQPENFLILDAYRLSLKK